MENEVNEEVVESANETTTTDNQEIDYRSKYEEAQKEANRLNSLIQKHKDKTPKKEVKSETPTFGKEDMEKMLSEREFYKENPTMTEYKEQLEKYTSNGDINLEQAKLLVMAEDSTIAARQNTQNSNFTDGTSGGGVKKYSQEDLYNLGQKNPALKRQAMEDIAAGKATETI